MDGEGLLYFILVITLLHSLHQNLHHITYFFSVIHVNYLLKGGGGECVFSCWPHLSKAILCLLLLVMVQFLI